MKPILTLGTWVLVADGRKALILRNAGNATRHDVTLVEAIEAPANPRTADSGTDRPGRTVDRSGGHHSVEQTDWHARAEDAHARVVAAAIDARAQAGEIEKLIVVAPPKTLAVLRASFTDGVKAKIVAEIDKDLTKHPIPDIARLLTA